MRADAVIEAGRRQALRVPRAAYDWPTSRLTSPRWQDVPARARRPATGRTFEFAASLVGGYGSPTRHHRAAVEH
jgi:hypothetical protein